MYNLYMYVRIDDVTNVYQQQRQVIGGISICFNEPLRSLWITTGPV